MSDNEEVESLKKDSSKIDLIFHSVEVIDEDGSHQFNFVFYYNNSKYGQSQWISAEAIKEIDLWDDLIEQTYCNMDRCIKRIDNGEKIGYIPLLLDDEVM